MTGQEPFPTDPQPSQRCPVGDAGVPPAASGDSNVAVSVDLIRHELATGEPWVRVAAEDVVTVLDRLALLEAMEQRARYWASRPVIGADARTVIADVLDAGGAW